MIAFTFDLYIARVCYNHHLRLESLNLFRFIGLGPKGTKLRRTVSLKCISIPSSDAPHWNFSIKKQFFIQIFDLSKSTLAQLVYKL